MYATIRPGESAADFAARITFDMHAADQRTAGDLDGAARTELLREYFTNTAFRAALEAETWRTNNP